MEPFSAVFKIVDELNCPLYDKGDLFKLNDKAVEFPCEKTTCLILTRELTQLLFKLISKDAPANSVLHGCGGCTGLIKFKRTDDSKFASICAPQTDKDTITGVKGNLSTLSATEVFQSINISEKNGIVQFDFKGTTGFAVFRDGEFIRAKFKNLSGLPAIFAMLLKDEGTFHFEQGLAEEDEGREQLGNFMMILMEGMRQADEEND
jgi:hypothetical protein